MVKAFHRLRGEIRNRVPFVKMIASIITIASGGSAGKEGPTALISSGLAVALSKRLGLSARRMRILLLAGASAGVGAIFRAPLGGAFFAGEVLYKEAEFEFEAIIPSIIASITSYAVFTSVFGYGFLFDGVDGLKFSHNSELVLYVILALICAGLGFVYVKVLETGKKKVFPRLPLPITFRPAVGGLMLGLLAVWLPQVLGGGYGQIQNAISDKLGAPEIGLASSAPMNAFWFLLLIAFAKMIATSCTISSGGSGGLFAPSLFIGAMVGGSFGYLVQAVAPGMMHETTRESLILVGMAGFFSGIANVPITSLIIITELTGSYQLIVPLMLTCTISFVLSRRWSIIQEQVATQQDSPAHLGDFVINVLEDMHVKDIFTEEHTQIRTVREAVSLTELFRLIQKDEQDYFPVVDREDYLLGIVSFNDVRQVLTDEALGSLVLAIDICETNVITTSLDEDLYQVLRKITSKNLVALPVVDSLDDKRLLGMLTRRDVIVAYDQRLRNLKEDAGELIEEDEVSSVPYRGGMTLTELNVPAEHRMVNRCVRDIRFPKGCLVASIYRGEDTIIPSGLTEIMADDRLLLLCKQEQLDEVRELLKS
jgi:CIC family chloride channel protein